MVTEGDRWIPVRIECWCGEAFVVRVEPRPRHEIVPDFSCSCGAGYGVPGRIVQVSRWVEDRWELEAG